MPNYVDAKKNIFLHQDVDDYALLPISSYLGNLDVEYREFYMIYLLSIYRGEREYLIMKKGTKIFL